MSQITTHILDTSLGKPARGVSIELQQKSGNEWETIGSGKTNDDGRLPGLLEDFVRLTPGVYRLVFDTGGYYQSIGTKGLYPSVSIDFEVGNDPHYHIPLLLNPFGYSTYRGS
ncbi:MAG: hydroxyisourate hydrolase [Bacteroidetes bacterium]|nr:MAG: hydroxyisourate hydrolase [Bacteroidota bacterium]